MKTVKKLLLSVLRIFTAVFLVCACVIVLGSVLPYLSDLKHSKLSFSQDKHTTAPHKDTTPTEKSQPDKIRAEAESGDAKAQLILGDRYFFGKADYPQDDKKAFEWFYKAYEHEEPANCANIALGNMYYTGRGVAQDTQKAFEMWDKENFCDPIDPTEESYSVQSYKYIMQYVQDNKDKERALKEGEKCINEYRQSRSLGCQEFDIDEENLLSNCSLGEKWYQIASELGHPEAKVRLAMLYLWPTIGMDNCMMYDNGRPQRFQAGKELLLSASAQGYAPAMNEMGNAYFYGQFDEPSDQKEAEKWYLKAAQKGSGDGAKMLARLYLGDKDSIFPANYKKVYYWANKAIEKGVNQAKYYLGMLYYNGNYVKKDRKKAFKLFLDAATLSINSYYEERVLAGFMLQKMYLGEELTAAEIKALHDKIPLGRCYYLFCTKGWIIGKENYDKAGGYEEKESEQESMKGSDLWQAAFENNDIFAQIYLLNNAQNTEDETPQEYDLNRQQDLILRALIALHKKPKDTFAAQAWADAKQAIKDERKGLQPITDYQTADKNALIQAATLQNDTKAQMKLGDLYAQKAVDEGNTHFYSQANFQYVYESAATEWYLLAAYSGDPVAQVRLASMYRSGRVGLDTYAGHDLHNSYDTIPQEIRWLEKAAAQNNPVAFFYLGDYYYEGVYFYDDWGRSWTTDMFFTYIVPNKEKAFKLYKKSAEGGYHPAMKKLAQMYETGDYVAKDADKARYWREKEQNSADNYKEWNSYAGKEYASKDKQKE